MVVNLMSSGKPSSGLKSDDPKNCSFFSTQSSRNFAASIFRAAALLPPIRDDTESHPSAMTAIADIIGQHPPTWQEKTTNTAQLASLAMTVVKKVREKGLLVDDPKENAEMVFVDLGAGKALFSRLIYEMTQRNVEIIAVDREDALLNYDPKNSKFGLRNSMDVGSAQKQKVAENCEHCPATKATLKTEIFSYGNAAFTRILADVVDLNINALRNRGKAVVVAKHLCGHATDMALSRCISSSLKHAEGAKGLTVEIICIAPCCHQKMRWHNYSNQKFLESLGLGGKKMFTSLVNLIQLSRHQNLKKFEYRKWKGLKDFDFDTIKGLGRCSRRILEEGRLRLLREQGFHAELVSYADESITPDNLVIIAERVQSLQGKKSGDSHSEK